MIYLYLLQLNKDVISTLRRGGHRRFLYEMLVKAKSEADARSHAAMMSHSFIQHLWLQPSGSQCVLINYEAVQQGVVVEIRDTTPEAKTLKFDQPSPEYGGCNVTYEVDKIRASEWQKRVATESNKDFEYEDNDQALEDFIVVHGAYYPEV